MFSFFSDVLGFIEVFFEYFLNFIQTLIMSVVFLAEAQYVTVAAVAVLPSIIGTMVTICIAVYVIRFLLLK